jgi:hypothetical protein
MRQRVVPEMWPHGWGSLANSTRGPHSDRGRNIKGRPFWSRVLSVRLEGFYAALLAKGIRAEMARQTLARKIAAIALIVWKKGARATPSGWLCESETLSERSITVRLGAAFRI